jgi:hypothetical protein
MGGNNIRGPTLAMPSRDAFFILDCPQCGASGKAELWESWCAEKRRPAWGLNATGGFRWEPAREFFSCNRCGGDTRQREVGYTEFFAGEPVPMHVVAGDDCGGDLDEVPESEADAAIGFQEQRKALRRDLQVLWRQLVEHGGAP